MTTAVDLDRSGILSTEALTKREPGIIYALHDVFLVKVCADTTPYRLVKMIPYTRASWQMVFRRG